MNEFQVEWKRIAALKNLTSGDMALLCLKRAVHKDQPLEVASKYLLACLKPITNENKIRNGAHPYYSMWDALRNVTNSPLFKILDEDTQSKIKILVSNMVGVYARVKLHGQ